MLVKVVHDVWASVHNRVCLIVFQVRDSIATVTGYLMFVDYTSLGIGIGLLVGGDEKAFEIANKEKFVGMLFVMVLKLKLAIISLRVNNLLSFMLRAENLSLIHISEPTRPY